MADDPDKGWLPVNQATALLGISQRTLYRRIEAGRYRVRHVDGRTQVWVADRPADTTDGGDVAMAVAAAMADIPGDMADAPTSTTLMADTLASAVQTLERLLEQDRGRATEAEERARDYAAVAAMWQERARNLEGEVGRLQELLALPAHEEPAMEPRRAPWWRRLFAGGHVVEKEAPGSPGAA